MSDYEVLEQWIKEKDYKVETELDNLIYMCFAHYEAHLQDAPNWAENLEYMDGCKEFINARGGLKEFDYYC